MVVAVPASLIVQRNKEEVLPFEVFQQRLAVRWLVRRAIRRLKERVAEWRAQSVEHTGGQQKIARSRCLAPENLRGEVVRYEAMAACEGCDECGDIRSVAQREPR